MYSSEQKTTNSNNSIRNALFDVAVQLSVPSVSSTVTAATKLRAYSTTEETIFESRSRSTSTTNSRYSLSSGWNNLSRHSDLIKPKVLRDVASQTAQILSADDTFHQSVDHHFELTLDNNNNPTMISSISDTSKEYLSVPKHHKYSFSPSTSPTRHGRSFKNTLLGLWQGLNSDEVRSAASSPIDPKYFEERVRIVRSI